MVSSTGTPTLKNPSVHPASNVPKFPIPWIGNVFVKKAKVQAKRIAGNGNEIPIAITNMVVKEYKKTQILNE